MANVYAEFISKKITVGLGYDYISGQNASKTSNTNYNAFYTLYPTNHKFYGHMDYFYVSSSHKNTGLWDNYLSASYKTSAQTTYNLAIHHFEAASKIIDYRRRKANPAMGNEVDFTLTHQLNGGTKITGGYSQMFTSTSMKYVKNIAESQKMNSTQNWLWISLNVQPEILLHSK